MPERFDVEAARALLARVPTAARWALAAELGQACDEIDRLRQKLSEVQAEHYADLLKSEEEHLEETERLAQQLSEAHMAASAEAAEADRLRSEDTRHKGAILDMAKEADRLRGESDAYQQQEDEINVLLGSLGIQTHEERLVEINRLCEDNATLKRVMTNVSREWVYCAECGADMEVEHEPECALKGLLGEGRDA